MTAIATHPAVPDAFEPAGAFVCPETAPRPPAWWQNAPASLFYRAPRIAGAARVVMASAIGYHRGFLELMFSCAWDPEARVISAPRLVFIGSSDMTRSLLRDAVPGEILLHNHPSTTSGLLIPSHEDCEHAIHYALEGIGSAIVSSDLSQLVMLREPPLAAEVGA